VLKISKLAPEPAARPAREKTPPPHNASAPPAEASDAAPADAAPEAVGGAGEARRKAAAKRARGLEAQRPPVQAQAPALSGGFRPDGALPPIETAASAQENAPPRAKSGAKRAPANASVARPRLGPAARKLLRWLKRHYGADAIESVSPLVDELLAVGDRLADVRRMLAAEGLSVSERLKLMRTEVQLNASFGRCWRLLGLAEDTPVTMPPGRPPRLE
jgi:hypothetical protein